MQYRTLGQTGLRVSEIGFGATQIGFPSVPEDRAERVLKGALDAGITFFDTAARYRLSEARIGRYLSSRKSEFVVSTKCGGWIDVLPDGRDDAHWDYTPAGILRTIDRSRRNLRLDAIDLVVFHGLPKGGPKDPRDFRSGYDVGAAFEALLEAKSRGWARFVGISAEGEAAAEATRRWPLDVNECNYNVLMQESESELFPVATRLGRGIIAKRPIANFVYSLKKRPDGPEEGLEWDRSQVFPWKDVAGDMELLKFNIRFTLSDPAVATAIIGTANPDHVAADARLGDAPPLPDAVRERARIAFQRLFAKPRSPVG